MEQIFVLVFFPLCSLDFFADKNKMKAAYTDANLPTETCLSSRYLLVFDLYLLCVTQRRMLNRHVLSFKFTSQAL